MWVVDILLPGPRNRWPFRTDYFPRKVVYKKEAQRIAYEAKQMGAKGVTVTKKDKGSDK